MRNADYGKCRLQKMKDDDREALLRVLFRRRKMRSTQNRITTETDVMDILKAKQVRIL